MKFNNEIYSIKSGNIAHEGAMAAMSAERGGQPALDMSIYNMRIIYVGLPMHGVPTWESHRITTYIMHE